MVHFLPGMDGCTCTWKYCGPDVGWTIWRIDPYCPLAAHIGE